MSDVYLRMTDRRDVYAARTVEATFHGTHTGVMVDLDAEGNILGFEVLDVSTVEVDGRPLT